MDCNSLNCGFVSKLGYVMDYEHVFNPFPSLANLPKHTLRHSKLTHDPSLRFHKPREYGVSME